MRTYKGFNGSCTPKGFSKMSARALFACNHLIFSTRKIKKIGKITYTELLEVHAQLHGNIGALVALYLVDAA